MQRVQDDADGGVIGFNGLLVFQRHPAEQMPHDVDVTEVQEAEIRLLLDKEIGAGLGDGRVVVQAVGGVTQVSEVEVAGLLQVAQLFPAIENRRRLVVQLGLFGDAGEGFGALPVQVIGLDAVLAGRDAAK